MHLFAWRAPITAIVALVVAASALVLPTGALASFGTAETVTNATAPAPSILQPHVVVDGFGNVVSVFKVMSGTTGIVYGTARSVETGVWSTPVALSTAGRSAGSATIAIDGQGNATAVWLEADPVTTNNVVRTSMWVKASASWSAAQTVSVAPAAPGTAVGDPVLAENDYGVAVVVWYEDTTLKSTYRGSQFGTWEAPATVATGAFTALQRGHDVAIDKDGLATVVFLKDCGGLGGNCVNVTERMAATPTWSPAFPISTSPDPHDSSGLQAPRVVANFGGTVHAVWIRNSTGTLDHDQVEATTKAAGDISWPTATAITVPGTSRPNSLDLDTLGNTGAVAIWARNTPGATVEGNVNSGSGWSLGQTQTIDTGAASYFSPQVSGGGLDRVVAVWNDAANQVRGAVGGPTGWSSAVTLECCVSPDVYLAGPTFGGIVHTGTANGDGTYKLRFTPWGDFPAPTPPTPPAPEPAVVYSTTLTKAVFNTTADRRSAEFSWESVPAGAPKFECSTGGGVWKECGHSSTSQNLSYGFHQFFVRAVNADGVADASPEVREWTITHECPVFDRSPAQLTADYVGKLTDAVKTDVYSKSRSCSYQIQSNGTDPHILFSTVQSVAVQSYTGTDGRTYEKLVIVTVEPLKLSYTGDDDQDGLLNGWEQFGYDPNSDGVVDVDLPAMGADPQHKDMFLQLDQMPGLEISTTAVADVVAAFAKSPVGGNPDRKTGVALHVDAGPTYPMSPGKVWDTLSESKSVPLKEVFGTATAKADGSLNAYDWTEFDKFYAKLNRSRLPIFRYGVVVARYGLLANGSSGIARALPSANLVIAVGRKQKDGSYWDGGVAQQTGTFMHEFGHTLNLHHGGDTEDNNKPNYLSIMNYDWQLSGLQPGSTYDYSRYSNLQMSSMNERFLDDGKVIGAPAGFPYKGSYQCGVNGKKQQFTFGTSSMDWNCNGTGANSGADINGDGAFTFMDSYDDWANISFKGGAVGRGVGTSEPTVPAAEVPKQTVGYEAPLEQLLAIARQQLNDFTAPKVTPVAVPKQLVTLRKWNTPLVLRFKVSDDKRVDSLTVRLGRRSFTVPVRKKAGVVAVKLVPVPSGTFTASVSAYDAASNQSKAATFRLAVKAPARPKVVRPKRHTTHRAPKVPKG